MYPQQQYQAQPYNFQQQQQQPYYSSFPDPSLHPPGTDPLANSTSFAPPVSLYTSQPTDYHNWIVPQSEPIRYDLVSFTYPFDHCFRICNQNLIFLMFFHLGCFLIIIINVCVYLFIFFLLKLLFHFNVVVWF
jgi:hypothetical protein